MHNGLSPQGTNFHEFHEWPHNLKILFLKLNCGSLCCTLTCGISRWILSKEHAKKNCHTVS